MKTPETDKVELEMDQHDLDLFSKMARYAELARKLECERDSALKKLKKANELLDVWAFQSIVR